MKPYWLEVPLIQGKNGAPPQENDIIIIGSGLSGASAGYFLQQKGFENITIIDYLPEQAATNRNCGHILHGTVESMKAFSEIHGYEKAKELWSYSIELCDLVKETINKEKIDADYRNDGYLVIAIDESEEKECRLSTKYLNDAGFGSEFIEGKKVQELGFKNVCGARLDPGGSQAHPVKFRNGLIEKFLQRGGKYFTGFQVKNVFEDGGRVKIQTDRGDLFSEAVVLSANAYLPLISEYFRTNRLVEPFRGQIITSKPLKHDFKVRYPHSFDHGYEYSLITEDNRLMIGGWRNHTPNGEVGTYDLEPNQMVVKGLKEFVNEHYLISEKIEWEFSWSGIMGASQTSLPFVGPTNSQRIFVCGGYTGHGFSWAHGCTKLLADMIAGDPLPKVAPYFSAKHRTLS